MAASNLHRDLRCLLGEKAVIEGDTTAYENGYRYGAGRAAAVVQPACTSEVSQLIRYCHANGLSVIPQGAHTGLVAAATPGPQGDQVVLSFDRMRAITHFSPLDRTATCMAGCRLSELNAFVAPEGLCLPIDLGADPSLGGMVASNTGGARLLRYGDMRHNLLGLEVVLPDASGTVLRQTCGLRKDNSGLDLKQIIAGSGGSLALITAVTTNLVVAPRQETSMLIVPRSSSTIPTMIAALEARLGEMLLACEGISRNAMDAALRHQGTLRNPFKGGDLPDCALLVAAGTAIPPGNGLNIVDLLGEAVWSLLEMEGAQPLATDALIDERGDFWQLRHAISDGLKRSGEVFAFDVSVPRSRLPELIEAMCQAAATICPALLACHFGHYGDGGMHFNLVLPRGAKVDFDETQLRNRLYAIVTEDFGGSISAEHGIGRYNSEYYLRFVDPVRQQISADIRTAMDPKRMLCHLGID